MTAVSYILKTLQGLCYEAESDPHGVCSCRQDRRREPGRVYEDVTMPDVLFELNHLASAYWRPSAD